MTQPGVAHLVVGLEQERRGQQAGRHAIPAIVGAVELGEVGVPKQPATQRGQQTVEGVLAHVVQIQPVRFPEAPLIGSLSQHCHSSLFLDGSSIAVHPADSTFRPDFQQAPAGAGEGEADAENQD